MRQQRAAHITSEKVGYGQAAFSKNATVSSHTSGKVLNEPIKYNNRGKEQKKRRHKSNKEKSRRNEKETSYSNLEKLQSRRRRSKSHSKSSDQEQTNTNRSLTHISFMKIWKKQKTLKYAFRIIY